MSDTVTNDSHPASPVERTAFIAAPLTVVQRKEKALLEELAQSQWRLNGALKQSTAPHLLMEAFARGLLLSDDGWSEAMSNALWEYTECQEVLIAKMNEITGSNSA